MTNADEDFDFSPEKCAPPAPKLCPPVAVQDLQTDVARQQQMLYDLEALVKRCTLCPLGRQNCVEHDSEFDPHVFSTMKPSRWMVVGQNPGYNECLAHQPFVGEAGRNFDERLKMGGVKREQLYISNACRCHTVGNEEPTAEQLQACEPFLRLELAILRPLLVVTLGAVPFQIFCPGYNYGESLGCIKRSKKYQVKVFPILHPSPRNMVDLGRRSKFRRDMRMFCRMVIAFAKTD